MMSTRPRASLFFRGELLTGCNFLLPFFLSFHTALAFDVSALRLAMANDRTLFLEKECKFHALLEKGTIILGVARAFESLDIAPKCPERRRRRRSCRTHLCIPTSMYSNLPRKFLLCDYFRRTSSVQRALACTVDRLGRPLHSTTTGAFSACFLMLYVVLR